MTSAPPPGWYDDPWRQFQARWWDGRAWTASGSSPLAGAASAAVALTYPRFVGGMNVPTRFGGRFNATVPLAVLTIDETSLTLHPRRFPISIVTDFRVPLTNISTAFRLTGSPLSRGVGIELVDGQRAYFWTFGQQDAVLAALQQHGVRVDATPQRAVGALSGQLGWSRRRRSSSDRSAAELPGATRPTRVLAPIGAILGIAFTVTLALQGGPLHGFFVLAAILSVINAFRIFAARRRY